MHLSFSRLRLRLRFALSTLQYQASLSKHLADFADTYEVKNAAKGPNKGSKFVSATTGAPGIGRLRPHHHITNAFKYLGLQSSLANITGDMHMHSAGNAACMWAW